MPVQIHNKEYFTVAERVAKFREDYPVGTIQTELIEAEGPNVIMKATILENDKVVATGFAEEVRGSTNINKTSALENCETSAVGRALAFFGLAGTEIASADEVVNAIGQQKILETVEVAHAIAEHALTVHTIKANILDNIAVAAEAWHELSDDEKKSLWIAPTKGGAFTTKEREIMKSSEFRKAYYGEGDA